MAALLLLAFHCLLRTGEGSGDALVVVALPWTKTGARYGAQEIVTIDDPMINGLLFYLRNGVEPRGSSPPCWRDGSARLLSKGSRLLFAPRPGPAAVQSSPRRCHEPLAHARVIQFKNMFSYCLTHFVALPLHPKTVLPGW